MLLIEGVLQTTRVQNIQNSTSAFAEKSGAVQNSTVNVGVGDKTCQLLGAGALWHPSLGATSVSHQVSNSNPNPS
jgi:hypothetical protein